MQWLQGTLMYKNVQLETDAMSLKHNLKRANMCVNGAEFTVNTNVYCSLFVSHDIT
jgi:hypothetical protein